MNATPTVPEASEPAQFPARGATLGRFLIVGSLGAGGMGMVLSAYDPQLDRKVALKLLRGDVWRGDRASAGRDRLMREAQAMARLSHPNVVTVHEVGFADDDAYLVMEEIPGRTLRAWLAEAPRRWPEILEVLRQAGQGLAATHEAGLVHRDFKPDNLLVGLDGRARVSDFGLAGGGTSAGTPAYMSPEQLVGEDGGPEIDQFAFCVTAWEALQGERPAREPLPPAKPKAPAWVFRALARGLAGDPDARWPSMEALLEALRPPRRLAQRLLLVAIAAGALGGSAFQLGQETGATPACDGGGETVASIWDDGARARVSGAFARTGRPHAADSFVRVDAALRSRAEVWSEVRKDACEANRVRHEQSDSLFDRRMRCLGRVRAELEGFVALLEAADGDTVDRAAVAAPRVGDAWACADLARLEAGAAASSDPAVEEARLALARLASLRLLGKWPEALRQGHELLGRARALGNGALTAAVLVEVGRFELDAGSLDAGISLLYEAVDLGAVTADDAVVADATGHLVYAIGQRKRQVEAGAVTYRLASAAAARAGSSPVHLSRLFGYRGRILANQGDRIGALLLLELGLAAGLARPGAQPYDVAKDLMDLAEAVHALGHVREARRIYEHALQLLAEVTGPEHPALAKALGHYAFLCLDAEDWAAAATALERALPIAERAFGPSHRRVGDLLYPLAITREGQGRLDDATAAVTRAHEIAAADPSDPLTPALLDDVMASVSARQGNAKAALGYAERAIEAKRRLYPAGHPGTAFSLQKRAEALEVAGDLAAARRSLEEALALLGDTEAWEQGEALAQMARVLVKAGEVELGIETYERALSLLAKTYGEGPRLDAPRTGLLHAKAAKLLGRGKPDVRAK